MIMSLEFPKGQNPVVVRQFKDPKELETWYKDKTGKKLPETKPDMEKLIELQGNNAIDTFFRIIDSLPENETKLNPRTNRLELVLPVEHTKAEQQKETLKKVNEVKAPVAKIQLEW